MRALVLALLLVGGAGCWRYPPPCPAITATATKPGPAFLWRVQGDGATVWLFGTEHDAGLELVPPVALAALDGATRFASELGDPVLDAWELRRVILVAHGPGIDQLLGDDWWDLVEALDHSNIDNGALARTQPWFAMTLLNNAMSGPRAVAMDTRLMTRAKSHHTPIDAMETFEQQAAAMRDVVSVEDLRTALHRRKDHRCQLATLQARYVTGNVELVTPMLVDERFAFRMLYVRNQAWLPALERYLAEARTSSTFVAVGVGHLIGEQGLPALLARAGYTVTRVER